MKQHLKQVFIAACLVASGFGISAGAALVTNNQTDWNGITNTVTSGRWSYLDLSGNSVDDPTSSSLLSLHYAWGDGSNNWCVDKNNPNSVWWVNQDGQVETDSRPMGWAYTVPTGMVGATISGTFGGPIAWNFAIFLTSDTNPGVIDLTNKVPLWITTQADEGDTTTFNIPTPVAAGNDLVFVSNNTGGQWWIQANLNATITMVPEPAALSLLALGGLVLFRRRR